MIVRGGVPLDESLRELLQVLSPALEENRRLSFPEGLRAGLIDGEAVQELGAGIEEGSRTVGVSGEDERLVGDAPSAVSITDGREQLTNGLLRESSLEARDFWRWGWDERERSGRG